MESRPSTTLRLPCPAASLWTRIRSALRGDTFRAMGDPQAALVEYRLAVQQSEASRRSDRVPRLLRKIASIERCRKENAKPLGHRLEAQGRLEAHPDPA